MPPAKMIGPESENVTLDLINRYVNIDEKTLSFILSSGRRYSWDVNGFRF